MADERNAPARRRSGDLPAVIDGQANVRRPADPSRRRSRRPPRRRPQVFPPQESLQVLRREDRAINYKDVRLLGAVRGGERQDRAAPSDRRVHAAPAPLVGAIKQARNIALLPFAGERS